MKFWHKTFFFSPRMPSTVDKFTASSQVKIHTNTSHWGCHRYNIIGIVLVTCYITASQQEVIHCCNFNTCAMPYSQHWGRAAIAAALSEVDGVYKSKIKQRKTWLKAFLSGQHVYTLLKWLWQDFSLTLWCFRLTTGQSPFHSCHPSHQQGALRWSY